MVSLLIYVRAVNFMIDCDLENGSVQIVQYTAKQYVHMAYSKQER